MLSASLLCLNKADPSQGSSSSKTAGNIVSVIYDDMELPEINRGRVQDIATQDTHDQLLEFTRIAGKSKKQLPLLGMPDKAFYHIH